MKKRVIFFLLATLMVVSLLPVTAQAGGNPVSIVDGSSYSNVQNAVNNAINGQTIQLNTTCTENVTIPAGKTVTIDLNGNVLEGTGTGSVITVENSANLTLTDSSDGKIHKFTVGENGLWVLDETSGTKTVTGGVITGGNASSNGGGVVVVGGTFNMYGGSIVGNKAENGGGVSNAGTFTMTGGTITGNTATKGGGVYTTSLWGVNILVGGTITGNTANAGAGLYYQEEMCFVAGTPITMADGSRKPIETLEIGDLVRVFDHESGTISTAKLFDLWKYPEKHSGVVTLHFSHDIDVTVVYGHSFFEREANKYISISRDNVKSYVGHEFYNVDDARWETLIGYDFLDGEVDTYVITSEKYLNSVANGMLNNEDGLYTLITNVFEFGDCLKIDAEKKASDIKKYGLWSFDNTRCISKNTYDMLNFQYLSVAFGKGMITPEEFAYLESFWTEVDPELLGKTEKEKEESKPTLRKMLLGASPLETPVPAPTTAGIYVGGSLKITGNDSGNLCISSGTAITIGTGTGTGGNGVVAPTETLEVGVTMQTPGRFTTNGASTDTGYFASDDTDYEVKYNSNGYLELAVKAKTIADILPEDFPTSSSTAWKTQQGINTCHLDSPSSCLMFYYEKGGYTAATTATVTPSGNDYVYTDEDGSVTFNMENGKLTSITAKFNDDDKTYVYASRFNVTVNAGSYLRWYRVDEGTAYSVSGNTLTVGDKTDTAGAIEGKEFDCWKIGETVVTEGGTITADTIFTAVYKAAHTYTVTFNTNGHGTQITAQTVVSGSKAIKPADPTASGYTFGGWYADAAFSAKFDFNTSITADTTIYAKWTKVESPYSPDVITYSIATSETSDGTFTVDKTYASAGSTVTITVTPDKGYTLETITVLDQNGKEVEVKNLGNGKFSFTMPSGKVTVSATFMEDNTMLNFCVDVKASDYYYDSVLWAYENGICTGVDATHFGPTAPVTRAQVVTFLWRAAGCPEPTGNAGKFTDVKAGSYYEKAVAWAIEQGITKGTSDTTFSPDAVCTRAQVVTFLARFAGVKDANTTSTFSDVKASDYFSAAVKWAKDNGVTEGTTATKFSPNDKCTRAQVVTFLYRWMVK